MVALADGNKVETFGAHPIFQIPHVKEGDAVAASGEFPAQSPKRVDVARDRRADDSKVQVSGPRRRRATATSARREGRGW